MLDPPGRLIEIEERRKAAIAVMAGRLLARVGAPVLEADLDPPAGGGWGMSLPMFAGPLAGRLAGIGGSSSRWAPAPPAGS